MSNLKSAIRLAFSIALAALASLTALADAALTAYLPENAVVDHDGYSVAFDAARHVPRFVIWRIGPGDATVSRDGASFKQDTLTPASPSPADYVGSGYDLGHQKPARDAKSKGELEASFLTCNVAPQLAALNRGDWKELETQLHKESQTAELVIICGPVFYSASPKLIGSGVAVPDAFFKIAYLPRGPPRAWLFPNIPGPNKSPEAYLVQIQQVETLTGLKFKPNVKDN